MGAKREQSSRTETSIGPSLQRDSCPRKDGAQRILREVRRPFYKRRLTPTYYVQ